MKILVWLACIFVYSMITTSLQMSGVVLGGASTALLALLLIFIPAPLICRAIGKRKKPPVPPSKPNPEPPADLDAPVQEEDAPTPSPEPLPQEPSAASQTTEPVSQPPLERWYTCPKCGQLVRDGETCDCEQRSKELEAARQAEQPSLSFRWQLIIGGLSILAFFSLVFAVLFSMELAECRHALAVSSAQLSECQATLAELEDDARRVNALESEYNQLKRRSANLLAVNSELQSSNQALLALCADIGFLVDGSIYYHTYDCSVVLRAEEFEAHSWRYCKYLGYLPCPACGPTHSAIVKLDKLADDNFSVPLMRAKDEVNAAGDIDFSLDAYLFAKEEWGKLDETGKAGLPFDEWWNLMRKTGGGN